MVEAEPSTEVLSQAWNSSDLVHQLRINRSLVILALLTRCVVLSVRGGGRERQITTQSKESPVYMAMGNY